MQYRPQEGARRAPAPAAALVHLEVGAAEVVAVVEHLDLRDAALRGGLAPGVDDLPVHARVLDAHLAPRAVAVGRPTFIIFQKSEYRQYFIPGPAAVAEGSPVVPVLFLPAHVDHRVDR